MNLRNIMKNSPNGVIIICGTILAVSVLAAYVYLANAGKDAAEISRFVNTLLNFAMLLIGSVGAVAAGSAARTSQEAKDAAEQAVSQTNGQLDARIETAILSALGRQQATNDANAENGPDQPKLF